MQLCIYTIVWICEIIYYWTPQVKIYGPQLWYQILWRLPNRRVWKPHNIYVWCRQTEHRSNKGFFLESMSYDLRGKWRRVCMSKYLFTNGHNWIGSQLLYMTHARKQMSRRLCLQWYCGVHFFPIHLHFSISQWRTFFKVFHKIIEWSRFVV